MSALGDALANQVFDTGFGSCRDHWTHFGVLLMTLANFESTHARRQKLNQGIPCSAHRYRHGNRHASLAGRTIGRPEQRVAGGVHIGVGHHDHVVLGAAQGLHPFSVGTTRGVDMFGNRGRAHETHSLNLRMGQDRVDDRPVAVNNVEYTVGKTSFLQQPGHDQTR